MRTITQALRSHKTSFSLLAGVVVLGFALFSCGGGGGYGGGGGGMGVLPPQAFNLLAPINGVTTADVTPTLSWSTSTYATMYTVEVSTSNTFPAKMTVSSPTLPAGTTMWKVTPALNAATAYFWRVTALNVYAMVRASNGPGAFMTP